MRKAVGNGEQRVHPTTDQNEVAGEQPPYAPNLMQEQNSQFVYLLPYAPFVPIVGEGNQKPNQQLERQNDGGPDQIVVVGETNKKETQSSFCGELDKFLTSLDLGKHSSSLSLQEFDLKTVQAMSKQALTDAGLPLGAAMKIVKFREEVGG